MRRLFLTCGVVSLLGLAACGSATESDVDADADAASASTGDAIDTATDSMASSEMAEIADTPADPAMGSLEWAIASDVAEKARRVTALATRRKRWSFLKLTRLGSSWKSGQDQGGIPKFWPLGLLPITASLSAQLSRQIRPAKAAA